MAEITIVASPSFDRSGKRHLGRSDVRLQGCDKIICEATQQHSRYSTPAGCFFARVSILRP